MNAMEDEVTAKQELNWLVSAGWWAESWRYVSSVSKMMILPAFLLAISNVGSTVTMSYLNGGFLADTITANQMELQELLGIALVLLGGTIFSLLAGLASLSFWLLNLTAIARHLISGKTSTLNQCVKDIKAQSKHLGGVWLVSVLYLLLPVIPLSILIAVGIMANMDLPFMEQPIAPISKELSILININAAVILLLTIDFTLLVTVFSTNPGLSPWQVNSSAKDVLSKDLGKISLLNIALFAINICISAPFAVIFLLPQLSHLWKDLNFNIACQVWSSMSTVFSWPLSLLLFVEYLKRRQALKVNKEAT